MTPIPPSQGCTVFVVDDDPSFRRAIARLLTASGYAVETFASAREFLERLQPEQRGCALVDLRMPDSGGLELQAALSRSPNPLPVIFLTGHGDIPTSVHAMRGGAEDFLTKPIQKDAVLDAVGRALVRDAEERTSREQARDLAQRFRTLTPREREVLAFVAAGLLNKEIATELGTTERTVKAHRASLMDKMRAGSSAELGRLAQELGLGPPARPKE